MMFPCVTSVDRIGAPDDNDWLVTCSDPIQPRTIYVRGRSETHSRDHRIRALGALDHDPTGNYEALGRDSS